jgi:PleD family two-component response regulator
LKWVDAVVTKSDGPHFLLSTVQSVLPTKPSTEVERDGVQASRRPTGRSIPKNSKYLILVVDDDPIVRESISVLLMAAGYNVVLAEDGFAALVQLSKTAPDFLISDLNMPGM